MQAALERGDREAQHLMVKYRYGADPSATAMRL